MLRSTPSRNTYIVATQQPLLPTTASSSRVDASAWVVEKVCIAEIQVEPLVTRKKQTCSTDLR